MKFFVFSLIGLIKWFLIVVGFLSGNLMPGDEQLIGMNKHPYLWALYGLIELSAMIACFIVFAKITHIWWQALLITVGIYVAFLAIGTFIELICKGIKKVRFRKTSN